MPDQWISSTQVTTLIGPAVLRGPAYRDLADRLRLQIVDGRLTSGVRLPSERALAATLGLSRTTVAAAYGRLGELGYLRAQRGSGNFVTLPRVGRSALPATSGAVTDGPISLTKACSPAPPGLGSAFLRASEQLPELLSGDGYLADGLPVLRERLAAWFTGRGLPTDPDQLIVTTGALSALNTVLRTLIGPGDRVVMESPTYPGAIEAVRRSGARLVGYPLGPQGWVPGDLDLVLRQTAPRLAFLIPEFHNPTGQTMPAGIRAEVGAGVQRNRTQLVVDETLVQLGLENQAPPPPLASFLPDAITIGSASKAYWGGLRIGWIRAPHPLIPALIDTRATDNLGSAAFEQLVVAELLADDGAVLDEHRTRLRHHRDLLFAAVRDAIPEWEVRCPDGGLSLWAHLPLEVSTRMAALADRYGLITTAGPRFFVGGGGERHLRIPYGDEPRRLMLVVERLEQLWRAASSGRSTGPISVPMSLTA